PCQRAPGRPEAVPAGDDRGALRRSQGAGSAHRRLPRGRPVVGSSLARLPPPRFARPGAGRRGRGARILERAARGVPGGPRAGLLVPQDIECSCRAAEVGAPGGEEGARRDLERRGQVPRPRRGQGVRVDLWCEVSEGGRQDQRRRRAAAGVLRLPGRALDSSENYKSDRIYLRHRAEPEQEHQGTRLPPRQTRRTLPKCPASRAAGIAMAYKLIGAAQSRWRAVNAPHLVALVRAGAKFENGKLVERPDDTTATEEAA